MTQIKRHRKQNSDNETMQMWMEPGDDHETLGFGPRPIGLIPVFDQNSSEHFLDCMSYSEPREFWIENEGHNIKNLFKI